MSITIQPAAPTSPVYPNLSTSPPSTSATVQTVSSVQRKFFPEETTEDRKIARALKYLDDTYSLKPEYLYAPLPGDEHLSHMKEVLAEALNGMLSITGNKHSKRAFLKCLYEASLLIGNPIKHFIVIGTTPRHAAGKKYVEKLLSETSDLLNKDTEQVLLILPKDLDIRVIFTKTVTEKQLKFLEAEAITFINSPLDCKFSDDPTLSFKFKKDKFDCVAGYFAPSNTSLLRNTDFHAAIIPQSLYECELEIKLLSRHAHSHRRAIVDALLGILYDENASEKNYLAIFTILWGILNGKKCYKFSILTSYLFAHINKFPDKTHWSNKFAEYIHNYIELHNDNDFLSKFLLALTFEIMCEKISIFQLGLKPHIDTAFEKLFPSDTVCEDIFFQARQKGVPSLVMATILRASCGLMLACPSVHNPNVNLTKLFEEIPYIELTHSSGLRLNFEWDLKGLCNVKDMLGLYLREYSQEIIELFNHPFQLTVASTSTLPVLEKYKDKFDTDFFALLPQAEELLDAKNEILQLIALSALMQLRALGVIKAEELLCLKGIPQLLKSENTTLRNIALTVAQSVLLSRSPAHLHGDILASLALEPPQNWMLALVKTATLPFCSYSFDLWKNSLQADPQVSLHLLGNMLTFAPNTAMDELQPIMETTALTKETRLIICQKIRTLLATRTDKITEWCKLYDICTHKALNIRFDEKFFKNRLLVALIKLKKENDPQATLQYVAELLALFSKSLWKDECTFIIEIFTTRNFRELVPQFLDYWTQLFVQLDKENPPEKLPQRTLLTLVAFATSWLYKTEKTKILCSEAYNVILLLLPKLSKCNPSQSAKLYTLCLAALKHPLFAEKVKVVSNPQPSETALKYSLPPQPTVEKDILSKTILEFIKINIWDNFPLSSLLKLAIARDENIFDNENYTTCIKALQVLLQEGSCEAINLSIEIAKKLAKETCHLNSSKEWMVFSNHLLLSARHTSSHIHLEAAQIVYNDIKNDYLLDGLGMDLHSEEKALVIFKALAAKFDSLTLSQKDQLFTDALKLIKISTTQEYYVEWFTLRHKKESFSIHQSLQLLTALKVKDPENISLTTILLQIITNNIESIPSEENEKDTFLQATSSLLDSHENISLKTLKNINLHFKNDLRIKTHLEKNLNTLIENDQIKPLIECLLDPLCEICSFESKDKALASIWSKTPATEPKMKNLIEKYSPQLTSLLWDKLWKWVENKGKIPFITQVYGLWNAQKQPLSDTAFSCMFLHAYDLLLTHYETPKKVFESLSSRSIPIETKCQLLNKRIAFETASEGFLIEILHENNHNVLWKLTSNEFHSLLEKIIIYALKKDYQMVLGNCCEYILRLVDLNNDKAKFHLDLIVRHVHDWPPVLSQRLALSLCTIIDRYYGFCNKATLVKFFPWLVNIAPTAPLTPFDEARAIQITLVAECCANFQPEITKQLNTPLWNLLTISPFYPGVLKSPSLFLFMSKRSLTPEKKKHLESLWHDTLSAMMAVDIVHGLKPIRQILLALKAYFIEINVLKNDVYPLLHNAIRMIIRNSSILKVNELVSLYNFTLENFKSFNAPPNYPRYITHIFLVIIFDPKGCLKTPESEDLKPVTQFYSPAKLTFDSLAQLKKAENLIALSQELFISIMQNFAEDNKHKDYTQKLENVLMTFFLHPNICDPVIGSAFKKYIKEVFYEFQTLGYKYTQDKILKIIQFYFSEIFPEHKIKNFEERKVIFWETIGLLSHPKYQETLSRSIPTLFENLYKDFPDTLLADISNTFTLVCHRTEKFISPFGMAKLIKTLIHLKHTNKPFAADPDLYPHLLCMAYYEFSKLTERYPPNNQEDAEILLTGVAAYIPELYEQPIISWPNFLEKIVEKFYLSLIGKFAKSDFLIFIFQHFFNTLYSNSFEYASLQEKHACFVKVFLITRDLLPYESCIALLKFCLSHPSHIFANHNNLLAILPQNIHQEVISLIVELYPCENHDFLQYIEATLLSFSVNDNSTNPEILKKHKLSSYSIGLTRILNLSSEDLNSPSFKNKLEILSILFLVALVDLGYLAPAQKFGTQLFEKGIIRNLKILPNLHPKRFYPLLKNHAKILAASSKYGENYFPINILFFFFNSLHNFPKQPSSNPFKLGNLSKTHWDKNSSIAYFLLLFETYIKDARRFPKQEWHYIYMAFRVIEELAKEKNGQDEFICQAFVIAYLSLTLKTLPTLPLSTQKQLLKDKIFIPAMHKRNIVFSYMMAIFEACNNTKKLQLFLPHTEDYLLTQASQVLPEFKVNLITALENIWAITQSNVCWNHMNTQLCSLFLTQVHIFEKNAPELWQKYHDVVKNLKILVDSPHEIPKAILKPLYNFLNKQRADLYQSQEIVTGLREVLIAIIRTFSKQKPLDLSTHADILFILELYYVSDLLNGDEGFLLFESCLEALVKNQMGLNKQSNLKILTMVRALTCLTSLIAKSGKNKTWNIPPHVADKNFSRLQRWLFGLVESNDICKHFVKKLNERLSLGLDVSNILNGSIKILFNDIPPPNDYTSTVLDKFITALINDLHK